VAGITREGVLKGWVGLGSGSREWSRGVRREDIGASVKSLLENE